MTNEERIARLKAHWDNLNACETFEEFKAIQLEFVEDLIRTALEDEIQYTVAMEHRP